MRITELGEFGLIDLLAKMVSESEAKQPRNPRLIIGIGDDAAAWRQSDGIQLATVDTLVQNVHFSLDTILSWRQLGAKALSVNISDIAAMAGVPEYALIALNLPGDTDVNDVTDLYRGILDIAKNYGISVVGGNMSNSAMINITITIIGSGREDVVLQRSAARPGDVVAVTGYPGYAAAGLEIITHGTKLPEEIARIMRSHFYFPVAHMIEAQALVKNGIKACIDVSDGLLADLSHICRASGVSAKVNIDSLPVDWRLIRHAGEEHARELTLTGGEAYELLFTGSRENVEAAARDIVIPVTIIGEIIPPVTDTIILHDKEGRVINIKQYGWQHF